MCVRNFLRLECRIVIRGRSFGFYLSLDYFQLCYISTLEALSDDVSDSGCQIKRRFGLSGLSPRKKRPIESLPRAMANLPGQNRNIDFRRLLLCLRHRSPLPSLASEFDRLVPQKALVRRIAGCIEADDRIRNLAGNPDSGHSDSPLLSRRPQFEVRCFRRGQRPMQVKRGLLPDRRSTRQNRTNEETNNHPINHEFRSLAYIVLWPVVGWRNPSFGWQ